MPIQVFTDTIASGTSTSSGVSIPVGNFVLNVVVPTMSTSAQLSLLSSPDAGVSYYQVFMPMYNTSTVSAPAFAIASGVGANGGMAGIPAGHQNIRLMASATVNNGVIFKIVCIS